MLSREQIDAGFEQARAQRFLEVHRRDIHDPQFWRALNPELTLSDSPFASPRAPANVEPTVVDRAARQILEEGYLHTPPLVPYDELARLRSATSRVVDSGFPSAMVCVYDEFYRLFQGLEQLFVPILGEHYRLCPQGLWTFFVPPGDTAYRRWSAANPHRDSLGPDAAVVARRTPSILAVWIPLTDVTPLESCVYIVPATCDPDYHSTERRIRPEQIRLQDIRALPSRKGSILAWSTHLLHWGSRSSRFASEARVSAALYLQSRDVPPFHPFTMSFEGKVTFEQRLKWIEDSLGVALQ